MSLASQERPLLLLLPGPSALAAALDAVLTHERVRAFAFPALWDLAWGSVDAAAARPDVRCLDRASLGSVVEGLLEAATPQALDAYVADTWKSLPDRVREWYLGRGALKVVASILRVGTPASSLEPPEAFRRDRILTARFEASYRLFPLPGASRDPVAPAEEASVVFYPFDPEGKIGREEAGTAATGAGASLELFAYQAGRERHREHLEGVASEHGWRVVDPPAS